MKRLIKTFSVILAVVIFALMAMGSGSSGSESTSSSGSISGGSGSQGSSSSKSLPTIEEQVLLDQDGFKITAIDYEKDSIWGEGIKLLLENNTSNDAVFTCNALIVNDYMINNLFACEVAAGKKANETIDLYSAELQAAGIDNVGKIEIYFNAFDSDWNNLFENVCAEIHTSAYESMDTQANDAGMELYNGNGIRIVGKTVDENSFWGTAILLYCENSSGRNVCISVEDMSVNGFMMDPAFAANVYDGKKAIQEITLFSSDLEANGITSIEEVELKFNIFDLKTYETVAETDPITFSAQ